MGMEDIGKADLSKQFQNGPIKESESFRIVGIVAFRSTVKTSTVKVAVGPNQVDSYRTADSRGEHLRNFHPAISRGCDANSRLVDGNARAEDVPISWHHQ